MPQVAEAVYLGLREIRRLDVTCDPWAGGAAKFRIFPGASLAPADFEQAKFFLNGYPPELSERTRSGVAYGQSVSFGENALFPRDVNYLLVQVGDKKTFFPLNAPPA
jgi:hypothetical protein